MANDYSNMPAGIMKPVLKNWEIIGWNMRQRQFIYRSWAQRFAAAGLTTAALQYFNVCSDENSLQDVSVLCMRSKFHRTLAQPEKALEDSIKATAIVGPLNAAVNVQVADALYDLNRFEDNKIMLHDNVRRNVGTTKSPFEYRLTQVNCNLRDSTGDSLSPFLLKNSAAFQIAHKIQRTQQESRHNTARWKYLRMLGICDVQSVDDKKVIQISPLEAARCKRKTKTFYQNYLNETWVDVAFLRNLRHNPNVLLNKYYSSATERMQYVDASFGRVKKLTHMLHARSPIYNETYNRFENRKVAAQFCQDNMFRIQNQTRRNMISILRSIRAFRQQNDVERLRQFISKVMGEYMILKTKRIMPWKFEFINEVYNHFALSLCEQYRLPDYKVSPYDNVSMCKLLGVSPLKPIEQPDVVFGMRSTYTYEDSGAAFEQAKAFKRTRSALERRLYFSKLPIERSYLLYELADCNLSQNYLVQCLLNAKKSIEEARKCNSKVWQFLATMLQAKSHAILCKYERQAEVLNDAFDLAKKLKSPRLCTFIELCRMLNRDYMTLRKMSQLVATKRLRSKVSNRSSCVTPQAADLD